MSEKPTVLFVDDEERILRSLSLLFRPGYRVLTTTDGEQALELLRRERVQVLVSDQRMPRMPGVELLRRAREVSPATTRLLLTGYSDLEAIIGSVNDGEVWRYVHKPWNAGELKQTVAEAADLAAGLEQLLGAGGPPAPAEAEGRGVLVLDEDPASYAVIKQLSEGALLELNPVHWRRDPESAFELLSRERIAVVVSELRVQGRDMSPALQALKRDNPEVVTIAVTDFQDGETLIDLINQGQVYRFLPKPLRPGMLEIYLRSAVQHHTALRSAPPLRQRHRARGPRQEAGGLPVRILDYLARIRQRSQSTV